MRASHRAVRRSAVVISSVLLAITVLPSSVAGATSHGARSARRGRRTDGSDGRQSGPADRCPAGGAGSRGHDRVVGPGHGLGPPGQAHGRLPTGNVLVWSTGVERAGLEPGHDTFTPAPGDFGDLHCAGESMLADGRVMVVGGQNGRAHNGSERHLHVRPVSGAWTQGADMAYLRWYATSTTLADGRVLATSGDAPDGQPRDDPRDLRPGREHLDELTGAPRSSRSIRSCSCCPRRVFEAGPGAVDRDPRPAGTPELGARSDERLVTNGYSESAVDVRPGQDPARRRRRPGDQPGRGDRHERPANPPGGRSPRWPSRGAG